VNGLYKNNQYNRNISKYRASSEVDVTSSVHVKPIGIEHSTNAISYKGQNSVPPSHKSPGRNQTSVQSDSGKEHTADTKNSILVGACNSGGENGKKLLTSQETIVLSHRNTIDKNSSYGQPRRRIPQIAATQSQP
jgi:hypothetical protein